MTLSYGKTSPSDLLAKAKRDLSRLKAAEAAQDKDGASDAVFDLAVALTSIKDWLREHPAATFTPGVVESYVGASAALSSFRDIANGGKHRIIRKYTPQTREVTASASAITTAALFISGSSQTPGTKQHIARLKIVRADGSRHRATDLGEAAIREWEQFMKQHGV